MFTFTDTEDNISGNAVTSDKVSTCGTRYENCDLTNIEECADDSDNVSKVKEPVETSTKACLVYDDVTVNNDVHVSNEKGQTKINSARSRFSYGFKFLSSVVLVSVFLFTGGHGNPMVCRTTYFPSLPMSRATSQQLVLV